MLQYRTYTNIGSREINEDSFGMAFKENMYCFAVADGLGGHGNGEIASQLAVEAVCSRFAKTGYYEAFFEDVFMAAQNRILYEQEVRLASSRMKTTLVTFVIYGDKMCWAHIGDSRLYMFKNGKLKQRTIDHSVPQMLALSNRIKEKEIRFHPDRNRLMRVLGVSGEYPRFQKGEESSLSGDQAFLLCSDGFWELIEEKTMEKLLKKSETPEQWLEQMDREIRQNGKGHDMDNYTAIAVFSKKGRWFK